MTADRHLAAGARIPPYLNVWNLDPGTNVANRQSKDRGSRSMAMLPSPRGPFRENLTIRSARNLTLPCARGGRSRLRARASLPWRASRLTVVAASSVKPLSAAHRAPSVRRSASGTRCSGGRARGRRGAGRWWRPLGAAPFGPSLSAAVAEGHGDGRARLRRGRRAWCPVCRSSDGAGSIAATGARLGHRDASAATALSIIGHAKRSTARGRGRRQWVTMSCRQVMRERAACPDGQGER